LEYGKEGKLPSGLQRTSRRLPIPFDLLIQPQLSCH
jgi:hypothetical protein